nr:MAG TPA: hypothetical protein [Caudoviricetes sp.]
MNNFNRLMRRIWVFRGDAPLSIIVYGLLGIIHIHLETNITDATSQ